MDRMRIGLAATAALVLVAGFGAGASAQDGYPPEPTGAQCAQTFNAAGDPRAVFDQSEDMEVAGEENCADGGASAAVSLESAPIAFCNATARADGSYSCTDTIPSNMPAGEHDVIVSTTLDGEDVTYRNIITVVAAGATLPATGSDIALLALWAVGFVVFGSLLISATWKHFRGMRAQAAFSGDGRVPSVDVPDDFEVRSSTWTDAPVSRPPPAPAPAPEPLSSSVAVDDRDDPDESDTPSATDPVNDVVARLKEEIKAWNER